jgi:hypothetical protein
MHFPSMSRNGQVAMAKSQRPVVMDKLSSSASKSLLRFMNGFPNFIYGGYD